MSSEPNHNRQKNHKALTKKQKEIKVSQIGISEQTLHDKFA